MFTAAATLLVLAWLPGAVFFRIPYFDRPRRASLPADERLFWQIIISVLLSLSIALALATAERYTLRAVLAANLVIAAAAALAFRWRLLFAASAPRPGIAALVPVALVALSLWRFFPPSEYLIGGKDPGTYMNEGIQIAQRGSLVIHDETVATLPSPIRDLFFPSHDNPNYYSLRFMGFFVQDPQHGTVVGQFPHLYPVSIALAYGVDGLTGARRVSGLWAILGVLGLFFAGARVAGRPVATAAAVLLILHVLQVWYAKYPNSEIMMQALLLAALLAVDRGLRDGDRFFALLGGALLGLQVWLRVDIALALSAVAAVVAWQFPRTRRISWALVVPGALLTALGVGYLVLLMPGYSYYPLGFTRDWILPPAALTALAAGAALAWVSRDPRRVDVLERWFPRVVLLAAVLASAYAWFFRGPYGRTAIHDAYAFRTFGLFYLTTAGVAAAIAGYANLMLTRFARAPALLLTLTAFAAFFFYKIRVVPEHFWMGRRFLAIILPGALLCISSLALVGLRAPGRRKILTTVLGLVFLGLLGRSYLRVSAPVQGHVEYAGVIPQLEALAAQFGDNDLVVVESRDASDVHVLALPLAYTYARHVLLLTNPVPDKSAFAAFLQWAQTKYARVFFLGGGGTDLLSAQWTARRVTGEQFRAPSYDATPWHTFPRGIRDVKFDYAVYEFGPPSPHDETNVDLDIGAADDLHVVRFQAREQTEGRTIRWTGRASYISLGTLDAQPREIVLWMNNGGRPAAAGPASVRLFLDDRLLGSVDVRDGFHPYSFAIPADLAATSGIRLRLESKLWNPHEVLGSGDDRQLGVMVDRVQVR